ncbi:MAG: hypothetical protein AUJ49_08150 [Desulfovibrionaceae bacterium CG1_02_65_16]|nr:MAG: hypothetical protein AUJ49_08150 [Desulfovibrionaceae bacterium CG1_02_65_16]
MFERIPSFFAGRHARRLATALLPAVLLATLAGCGAFGSWDTTASSMRSTMRETRDFINPAPRVDVERYKWNNPNQEKLALLFSPVDAKVMALSQYVTSIDSRPDQPWIDALLLRFPWVDGIIVADAKGEILTRKPPVPLKRFSEPLVFESIWRETLIKTVVDYTSFGPELYFGMPNYEGPDFVGLHVVYFDPRVLFTFCPQPQELLIIDPRAKQMWTAEGSQHPGAEELLATDWLSVMKEKIHGTVMAGGKQYTWLARFIGRDLFVYATESANASFEDKGFSIPFFGGNS